MKNSLRRGVLAAAFALVVVIAHAGALSNYMVNNLVDYTLRAQTFTPPTSVYFALETAAGSQTGCGTEVSGGSYARVAVTASLANFAGTQSAGSTSASSGTSGQTSNNGAVTFPAPTANWGTVTGFCVMDAASAGHMLFRASLTSSKTVNSGDAAPSFAIGAMTLTYSQNLPGWFGLPSYGANDAMIDRRRVA